MAARAASVAAADPRPELSAASRETRQSWEAPGVALASMGIDTLNRSRSCLTTGPATYSIQVPATMVRRGGLRVACRRGRAPDRNTINSGMKIRRPLRALLAAAALASAVMPRRSTDGLP